MGSDTLPSACYMHFNTLNYSKFYFLKGVREKQIGIVKIMSLRSFCLIFYGIFSKLKVKIDQA